ncbi:hypothetical protein Asppvi_005855 [Aspergillus pseudoviridinutans]|uniref:Uncharacterized protein n=1 Tax=Aspergillus pseudoviridinutans TaxID=1517512 RepID=A0A9P3B911_9EURO|nr:uncharacterized protein Asppvi_005855 [Aspergillus pseudoviridinutans]GIJ86956.1 hypothetical protein Asppvi_005855 [Aspergillus pseudoviridinutans]
MADQASSDQNKGKEAVVGIKADVRTLQQLSSSGQAAKKKREENQVEKGMRAIGGAIQAHLQQGSQSQGSS